MIFHVQETIFEIFYFGCRTCVSEIFLGVVFGLLSFSLLSLVATKKRYEFFNILYYRTLCSSRYHYWRLTVWLLLFNLHVYNCSAIFIEHYATLCLSLCKYVQDVRESNHESYCTILLNIYIFNNIARLDETWANPTWKSRGAASRRRLCPIAWNEAYHSRLTSSSYIFSDVVLFFLRSWNKVVSTPDSYVARTISTWI